MSATPSLHVIRDDIQALNAYAVQDAQGFIKLDAMENPYTLAPEMRAALAARLAQVEVNRYPGPRVQDLKRALMSHAQVPAGFELMLGNGSDELIGLLDLACAKPGAVVLAPEPGFVMYAMSAKLLGLTYVGVPLQADFELDLPAMQAAIQTHRPARRRRLPASAHRHCGHRPPDRDRSARSWWAGPSKARRAAN